MTEVKTVRASFKAVDGADGARGHFEAFASIFGNVDHGGDRVMAGAFTRTLDEWAVKGDPIPVILSHKWDDPDAYLGEVLEAAEKTIGDKAGLWYRAKADLDHAPSARVFDLLKRRLITQQSFAYDVVSSRLVEEDNDSPYPQVRELLDLNLHEVGPTLLGMNGETELLEAASRITRRRVIDLAPKGARMSEAKATVTLDGSYEALQQRLGGGVSGWAASMLPEIDIYVAYLEATYPDHVVVYVESWSDPYGGGRYFAADYELSADGYTLGEPREVTVTGTVGEKQLPHDSADAKAAADVARKSADGTKTSDAPASGDNTSTIDNERLMVLLTRREHGGHE